MRDLLVQSTVRYSVNWFPDAQTEILSTKLSTTLPHMRSPKQHIKHVFFDVFDTLIYPREPVHIQYVGQLSSLHILTLVNPAVIMLNTPTKNISSPSSHGSLPELSCWYTCGILRSSCLFDHQMSETTPGRLQWPWAAELLTFKCIGRIFYNPNLEKRTFSLPINQTH